MREKDKPIGAEKLNILGKINDGISGFAASMSINGINNIKLYIGRIKPSVAYGSNVYLKPSIQSTIGKSLERSGNIAGITISLATIANTYIDEGYAGQKTKAEISKSLTSMTGAWAGAEIGATAFGIGGGIIGGPIGAGIGGVIGGIVGGIGGGLGASWIVDEIYQQ